MGSNLSPQQDRDLRSIGVAMTMGFGIAVSLALFVFGGVWLDQHFDKAPLFMLIGLMLGLVAAGYQLYELVLAGKPDRENGPIGRSLQRTFSQRSQTPD